MFMRVKISYYQAFIGSPHAGVARAAMGALEVSNGALECRDVSKRSSYKGLFLVCLMDP